MPIPKGKPLSENQARIVFRDRIRGSREITNVLDEARQWLPPTLFDESVAWILRQSPMIARVLHARFPEETADLGRYRPLQPVSFRREVHWARALLTPDLSRIQQFITLRENIQGSTLRGDLGAASEALAMLRTELGASHWWIKHALALKQLADGMEGQKQLAAEIKSAFLPRSLNQYIVHQTSVRNEPSVTSSRFIAQLRDEIDAMPLDVGWRVATKYHVTGGWPTSVQDTAHVLRHATAESMVDLYEALIYVARVVASRHELQEEKPVLVRTMRSLQSSIVDPRIASLLFALEHGAEGQPRSEDLTGYYSFLSKKEKNGGSGDLYQHPLHLGTYLLAAHGGTPAGEPETLFEELARSLAVILAKGCDADLAAGEMDRAALAFPGFEVVEALQAISLRELSPVPASERSEIGPVANAERLAMDQRVWFALAPVAAFHPMLLRFLPPDLAAELTEYALREGHIRRGEFPWVADSWTEPTENATREQLLSSSLQALGGGDYNRALEIADPLRHCGVPAYEIAALRIIAHGSLQMGRIRECVELVTDEYIRNPNARYALPIRDLTDSIDKPLRRTLGADLSLAILYDIYSRHIDGAYENMLRRAVADALRANGASRPSDLRNGVDRYPTAKLVYFLRYACVPEITYVTGAYESTRDLLEERIAILQWLTELDPGNLEDYQAEIVDRTRRIVLHARRAEVEQSKIELNLDGFLREAEKSLRESYERYLAFRRARVTARIDEPEPAKASHHSTQSAPLLPSPVPMDEASALFRSIVRELRDIFIGDRYYGLDGFLSTRIRHGVIESELRSPLVASRLVTPRDAEGQYRFNEHWLSEIKEYDPALAESLNADLSGFARAYDALVQEIKNEWIRIRRADNESGMIEISLSEAQVSRMETVVAKLDLPFGSFASSLFEIFTNSLEPNLAAIRERLADEAKRRALELVDELERALQTRDSLSTGLLHAAREVRGAIPRAFDRVISWFKPAYESASEPLPVADVVQISVEIAQHFNPRFDAVVTLGAAGDLSVPGTLVTAYTDILLILFDNVLKHAGLLDAPLVYITGHLTESTIRFELTNQLGPDVDQAVVNARVGTILGRIRDGSYREAARGESGTGLSSVYDTIRSGLSIDPQLDAYAGLDRVFRVSFNLPRAVQ